MAETYCCFKIHPGHCILQLEGNPQHVVFPEEQRLWNTLLVPQLLKLPPEGLTPKLPGLGMQLGLAFTNPPLATLSKDSFLNGRTRTAHNYPHLGLTAEGASRISHLHFSRKWFDCIHSSLQPEGVSSNKPAYSCWPGFPQEPERASRHC